MKDAYTQLMVQQHTSAESDEAFFHKLNEAGKRKKQPVWKIAAAVACLILLIPVTALAAKYILHKPQVAPVELEFTQKKIANYGTFKGMETIKEKGYEIDYPDLALFSIDEIPEQFRNLGDDVVAYNSWEGAADALQVGVLKNTFLSDGSATLEYCQVESLYMDDQPYALLLKAQYRSNDLVFCITATIGIENADVPEEEYDKLRKSGSSMAVKNKPTIYNNDYTTAAGIPVIISHISTPTWYRNNFALYYGDFAANNIKYSINFPLQSRYHFSERNYKEDTEALTIRILEGFTFE